MNKPRIFVKHLLVRPGQFQLFQHEFVEAMIGAGIEGVAEKHCSGWIRKEFFLIKGRMKRFLLSRSSGRRDIVVVPCRGDDMHYNALPYYADYEIVPMLWDAWPAVWAKTVMALRMLDVRLCLCSSRQVAERINRELGIKTLWVPEGIDIRKYIHELRPLHKRSIEMFELGRQYGRYHDFIGKLIENDRILYCKNMKTDASGRRSELTFPTPESLIKGMRDVKCVACFPRCMTHPHVAGDVETLTIRYWECMLSGCIIVGHAPQELIDVVGYNPVVAVDWDDAAGQLSAILANIEAYEALVRKNYHAAVEHASWDCRMSRVKAMLKDHCRT